jgi:pimeloyl-ACP methyl ester carboxylesterase
MRTLKTFSALTTAALSLTLAASAGAAAPTVVKVGSLPGTPAKYNKVFITKYGPSSAKKVLLLIPGTNGGAENFALVGPELAKKVPGLQVWAMDRREQALEDNSMMQKVLANKATAQQALDYYLGLGWLKKPVPSNTFVPLQAKDFRFMKDWGMKMQVEDARAVILQAKKQGKTVILGGHSLGASMAAAYAAWDFNGKPGYKDIAGIVAIDGGLAGTFDATDTAAGARASLAKLDVTAATPDGPWANLLGLTGFAWATGPFAQIGALAALKAPNALSVLASFPLLPSYLKADVPTTNEGALGFAFDNDTSPKALSLIQVRAGQLATSGDPRGWQNGEVTPVQNIAKGFAGNQYGTNSVDWYYPARLNVDTGGASSMDRNSPAAKVLGLRVWHIKDVNVPYYAFQTSLSGSRDGVVNGAKNFAARSKVPKSGLVIVDAKTTTSHLDPLLAAPATNDFLKTVIPFLKSKIKTR